MTMHVGGIRLSPEGAAAFLLRFSLGVLFLSAGLGKFLSPIGAAGVSHKIMEGFKDTPLPAWMTTPFLYALPYMEITIGTVLILGIFTYEAMTACGLLLLALAFGKMFQQDPATVAHNLNFVFMTAVGLWFASRDNPYSLDHLLGRK